MAVTQAAMKSDRTISEELVARVQSSFEWEEAFGDVREAVRRCSGRAWGRSFVQHLIAERRMDGKLALSQQASSGPNPQERSEISRDASDRLLAAK